MPVIGINDELNLFTLFSIWSTDNTFDWLKLYPSDCIGVIDCEWCELEGDGLTRTRQAFCSTQRTCFGGILGARSPYNDHIPYRGK